MAVHSMNPKDAPQMVARLETAGFPVTWTPFAEMSRETFERWCDGVRENRDIDDEEHA